MRKGKIMSTVSKWAVGLLTTLPVAGVANDLYVDKTGEGGAYTTIQAAVDAANVDDTVWVRPGVYDEGGKTFEYTYKADASGPLKGQTFNLTNRIHITKRITLRATSDDPADTHIVGTRDPNPADGNTWGIGPAAVRCVSATVSGVVIKGFTIRDGASQALTAEGDIAAGHPGSVIGPSNKRCFVVDCVVSNCVGTRACGVRYCTAVRTLFSDNTAYAGNAPGRESVFFHCVIRRCPSILMSCTAVNSTFVETSGAVISQNEATCAVYNSISTAHGETTAAKTAFCNAVTSEFKILDGGRGENNVSIAYPLFAPLKADYRPLAGSGVETLGRASYLKAQSASLDVPEIVEIYKSMDGVTIDPDSTEPIAAGACQKAATAATGAIQYSNSYVETEGYLTSRPGLWAFSETTPDILASTLRDGDKDLFSVERATAIGGVLYPKDGNTFHQPFPPVGLIATNAGRFVTKTYYVNPDAAKGTDDAREEGRGLSADKPFRSLQYAIDCAETTEYVQIFAAAGHYDEGSSVLLSHNARVAIDRKRVRLIGAGVGQSFIDGAADTTDAKATDGSGRGPNAVRCVAVSDPKASGFVNVRGFTVQDGYSSWLSSSPTVDGEAYSGGLVYAPADGNVMFSDCEFRGGRAYRGAQVVGGSYERCRFTACETMPGGAIRQAKLFFCVADDIAQFGGGGGVVCDFGTVPRFCTVVTASRSPAASAVAGLEMKLYDSVIVGNNGTAFPNAGSTVLGSVLDKFTSYPALEPGMRDFTRGDPAFVNAANGDYRVGACSPAVTVGAPSKDWWKGPVHDFNGRLMKFRVGKAVAGAFQYPVQTVVVGSVAKYAGASISNVGTNFVEEGDSLTVTAQAATGRPLLGFKVNGEEVRSAVKTYTVTAPTDGTLAPVALEAWYQTDWYVDAAKKDAPSAGDGFTPETAKGTLAAAMTELPLAAGDTVHAAAGTYRDGDMEPTFVNSAPSTIHSRVVVPSGVTLVADDGPEETIIEGSSPTGSGNRFSADAVRCVSLCKGATIKGFTLLGGQTMDNTAAGKTVNGGQDDGTGGGVLAQTGANSYVRDCVITNCCACRGGGASGTSGNWVHCVNCRFLGNSAGATSSAAYYGSAYGCFFDGNVNGGAQVFRFCYGLFNCTVTANNNGNFQDFCTNGKIQNSIVLIAVNLSAGVVASNTIYKTFGGSPVVDAGGNVAGVSTAADAGLDAACRPVKGGLAMDSGDNALVSDLLDGLDLAGGQRIYNGTVDRGCYEYDWRGDYAADLGGAGVVVTKADPQVVESDGQVLVKGGSLAVRLTGNGSANTKYTIPCTVNGTGSLAATLNGEELEPTEGGYFFRNKLAENDLVFTYAPGAADAGGALFGSITSLCPGLLLLVR